ncbi:GNAT family N-acetyltransferase [Candidatus Bathyarchaeota archaeon]|nr:GNAT family N-acetyltransferase [Candidatus Bathyarchaeota archaeon]
MVAKEKDEMVAVAPLMMSKYSAAFCNMKKIEFIGTPTSDYNIFILRDNKLDYVKSILDYLVQRSDWDIIELRDIPETAASLKFLKEIAVSSSQKFKGEISTCSICPYLPLPSSFEVFMKNMSKNRRWRLKNNLAKLKANYKVELKSYSDFGSVREAMEALIKLHQERWESKRMPGMLASSDIQNFHMEVAEKFAQKGWLGLYFLTADGQPISGEHSFEYNKKIYHYLTGLSPSFLEYRVGHLMLLSVLESGIKRGFNEIDMLRGEEPYKTEWGAINRKNFKIRFIGKGLIPRIYDWASKSHTIRSTIRKFKL